MFDPDFRSSRSIGFVNSLDITIGWMVFLMHDCPTRWILALAFHAPY